jgi:hypothetical protein
MFLFLFCSVCFCFSERRVRTLHAYCPGWLRYGVYPTMNCRGTPARRKRILPRDAFCRMVRIPFFTGSAGASIEAQGARSSPAAIPAERPGTRHGQRFQYRCGSSPGNSGCKASSLRSSRVKCAVAIPFSSKNEIGRASVRR